MICEYCKTMMQDGARFCPNCGNAVRVVKQGTVDIANIPYVPPSYEEEERNVGEIPTQPKWEIPELMEKEAESGPIFETCADGFEDWKPRNEEEPPKVSSPQISYIPREEKKAENPAKAQNSGKKTQSGKRTVRMIAGFLAAFITLSVLNQKDTGKKKTTKVPKKPETTQATEPEKIHYDADELPVGKLRFKEEFLFNEQTFLELFQEQMNADGIPFGFSDRKEVLVQSPFYYLTYGDSKVGSVHLQFNMKRQIIELTYNYKYTEDEALDELGKKGMKTIIQTAHGNMTEDRWEIVRNAEMTKNEEGTLFFRSVVDNMKITISFYEKEIWVRMTLG